MRVYTICVLIFLAFFYGCQKNKDFKKSPEYKGLPKLLATSLKADYKVNDEWKRDAWTISPQVEFDSLLITCHSDKEEFTFATDLDSISAVLKPGKILQFYVSLKDTAYALTVIKGIKPNFKSLNFDTSTENQNLEFLYEENSNNPYLDLFRTQYPMDSLIKNCVSDAEKILKVMNWAHNQWEHNGSNEPSRNEALTILKEAETGKNFRCVEYATVTATALNSLGLKSRVMGLKTKDAETRQYGAGHVLLEVYLNDLKKWVVIDSQWDAMPTLNNVPLNAVEFQKAISENYDKLKLMSYSDLSKRDYVDWVYPYLFYFDIKFDNREGLEVKRHKIDGKNSLMLVPLGAKNLKVFQRKFKLDNCIYTNSLKDFYRKP